jgi:hypothetical protein
VHDAVRELEIIGANHDFLHKRLQAMLPYNSPSQFKIEVYAQRFTRTIIQRPFSEAIVDF